jgi:sulfur carrier protein
MLNIRLNDKMILLNPPCSLAELLAQQNYTENYFAVAINRHFIPRSQYKTTFLKEGDVIELVLPMQGG